MEDPVYAAARAAIVRAIEGSKPLIVTLRGDPARGISAREIEGLPYEIGVLPDGRERVFLGVAEGTEQMVLLSRIAHVRVVG